MDDIFILIPSYQPTKILLKLVSELRKHAFPIVIVRDGCNCDYDNIYQTLETKYQCRILAHDKNLGKGRALKTGFHDLLKNSPKAKAVITVDSDGQHSMKDILKLAKAVLKTHNKLILGTREFDANVPLKSKIGNQTTRFLFRWLVGKKINDTQTGLRAIPTQMLERFLDLSGDRYDYELNMLIATRKFSIEIEEIIIKTIYIEGNQASHFRPLIDSIRIYRYLFLYFSVGYIVIFCRYILICNFAKSHG